MNYQVKSGDSPAIISRKLGVPMAALIAANAHKPTALVAGQVTWRGLRPGELLNIPRRTPLRSTLGDRVGVGDDGFATITSSRLNIRSAPSATATIVGGSSAGDIVNVIVWNAAPPDSSAPQGWAQVSSPIGLNADGTPGRMTYANGFMSKQYLDFTPSGPTPISAPNPMSIPQIPGLPPMPGGPGTWAPIPGPTPGPLPAPAIPTPLLAAATAMNSALLAHGYKQYDQPIYKSFQSTAGLTADGFPGRGTMGQLQTVLSGAGIAMAPVKVYPWAATGAYDGVNAPTTAEWTGAAPSIPTLPVPVGPTPTPTALTAVVTTSGPIGDPLSDLKIHSAPSASSPSIGGATKNGTVTVLNWNAGPSDPSAPMGWAQIAWAGDSSRPAATGYSSKQYLNCPACAAPVTPPPPTTQCPPGQTWVPPVVIMGMTVPGTGACVPTAPQPKEVIPTCPPGQVLLGPFGPCGPAPAPPPAPSTTCPPGQTYIPPVVVMGMTLPGTGTCMPTLLPAPPPPPAPKPSPTPAPITSCPPGQTFIPAVIVAGVQITPATCIPIGITPAPGPGPMLLSCPSGQILNPLTGKCVPAQLPPSPISVCPAGQVFNVLTLKCEAPALPPVPTPKMCPDGKTLAPGGDVTKCPAPIQPAPPVTPPEKAGLSTGAIVAAGLGAAALVGVVAYAATRKKKKGHVVHRKTPRHHGKRK